MKYKPFSLSVILILIFGAILRLKAYFAWYTPWLDECSLFLSILHRGLFGYFIPLEHVQSAPPLFMMATKIITNIFNINEFSLRFIPFLASILSLPVFYLFSRKFLEKKYSMITALLLFCINYQLIYYSVEFKQYSSDVLICLVVFLFYESFDTKQKSCRKMFLLGLGAFLTFLFCMPSIFITGGYILCCVKNLKSNFKKLITFLSPFIIFMPVYYIYSLYPSKFEMMNVYKNLWQSGFITLNPLSTAIMLRENMQFFFNQKNFTLFAVILLITGLCIVLRDIKEKEPDKGINKANLLLAATFACVITASFLEIYPLKERVALYILPFFLILIIKPLDTIDFKGGVKNIIKNITVVLLMLFFISAYNLQYFSGIYKTIESKKSYGDRLMQIMSQNYKDSEIVVYNDASMPIYTYNSVRQNFKTNKFIMINLPDYSREYYQGLLNQLPKGYVYWFYYPYDYWKKPVIHFVEEWAKDKNVIFAHKIGKSYLLHVKL